ncbi:MAG: hypothetical protein IJT12_00875 [Paludibacteraceae bacterium]|nr:hypothetical protein [Paludibacteraceae bacterium]
MNKVIASLLVICQLSIVTSSAAIRVHTIGDSTMADYNPSATDKRGWGTYLGSFFDPAFVTVNNRGKSGASTRTFYDQPAFWTSVKSQMTAGDYVLIQFAHNDEKSNGLDVLEYNAYLKAQGLPELTDLRGTCPNTTYKDYLRRYIRETRELGCTPVLVAPICRKYFLGDSTIRRNGQHDLGDKFNRLENGVLYENQKVPADDHSMDYVYQMRLVAEEMNVPFLDMTTATRELYLRYGDAYCTQNLFCQGDKTHTAELGAMLIAQTGARLLKQAGILADYITIHEVSEIRDQMSDVRNQMSAAGAPQEKYHLSFINYQLSTRNLCVAKGRYHNSDNGTSKTPWPADEIDENAVRYIDLAVTAPADSSIRITAIAMDITASGCATMSCHINTGFGDAFTDVHTYYERVGLPKDEPTPVAIAPTHLTVPAGKTLHIRILPWLNGETQPRSGKYISLSNIRIEGYACIPK